MLAVGPYNFTEQDVHTTLQAGRALFDLLEDGLPPRAVSAVAPHRRLGEAALEGVMAGTKDPHQALPVVWNEWRVAMEVLRADGAFGPSASGTATALFRSGGGVPKLPVDALEVGWSGAVGDRQRARKHHGRPFQALCLWSNEVIDGFRAQGHPLAPGLAGENVTLAGIDWTRMRPGVRLRLGDVLAEVSSYATPCIKNAPWFIDGDFNAMHIRNGPVSRIYATVLETGRITVGDAVLLEPRA